MKEIKFKCRCACGDACTPLYARDFGDGQVEMYFKDNGVVLNPADIERLIKFLNKIKR